MRTFFLLVLAQLCFIGSFAQGGNATDYKVVGAPMPPMKLLVPYDLKAATAAADDVKKIAELKTKQVTNSDLSAVNNTFVVLFLPTCDHCQTQAKTMIQNISLFKNNKVIFMAVGAALPYLEYFDSETNISKYPETFVMGVDGAEFIEHTYLKSTTPQVNIYSPSQKLLKIFVGGAPVDSLKKYLN